MVSLEPKERARLRDCLDACSAPLLLVAADDKNSPESNFHGTLGLIDWRVHGHVSQLLARGALADFNLIPNLGALGKAALLVMKQNAKLGQKLPQVLAKLQVGEVCVAESTFLEKDLQALHDTLRKAQVSWNRLESLA